MHNPSRCSTTPFRYRDRRFRHRDRSFRSDVEIGHDRSESSVTMDRNPRSRYAGMTGHDAPEYAARMKELEEENRRLKKMYAEERMKDEIVAEALAKKW